MPSCSEYQSYSMFWKSSAAWLLVWKIQVLLRVFECVLCTKDTWYKYGRQPRVGVGHFQNVWKKNVCNRSWVIFIISSKSYIKIWLKKRLLRNLYVTQEPPVYEDKTKINAFSPFTFIILWSTHQTFLPVLQWTHHGCHISLLFLSLRNAVHCITSFTGLSICLQVISSWLLEFSFVYCELNSLGCCFCTQVVHTGLQSLSHKKCQVVVLKNACKQPYKISIKRNKRTTFHIFVK